jgi:hypothetical protein
MGWLRGLINIKIKMQPELVTSERNQASKVVENLEGIMSILKHLRTVATLAALGVIAEGLILGQPLWGAIFPCSFFTGL